MDPFLMLALAEGFGEGMVPALLAADVDPAAWLHAPEGMGPVPPRVAARLRDPGLAAAAARPRAAAHRHGLTVLVPTDAEWPTALAAMPLRPLVLFVRGRLAALHTHPAVAVVGSRTPTPYGRDAAHRIASALVGSGAVLWSGLARGIDAIAHSACVEAGRPTVAVLAGGLDRTYPPEHEALAQAIVAAGGCLVSELPPGHRARRGHFPRRNRLLAVGADAVVVVEASLASGALHTARFAGEHGTDVFALPGPWTSERSQGCHRLLAEGAHVVESEPGLLRDLGLVGELPAATALGFVASSDAAAVLTLLRTGPRPGDLLQRESGLDRTSFLRTMFDLVAQGAVVHEPGDLWRRTP